MKIKSIRIENFRSFLDETIPLERYSCFVGPNGAGKSTVLAALNVFFQERAGSATDVAKLIDEDYFGKRTENPIRITLTFDDLSDEAQSELAAYVRQGELAVTVEFVFNSETGFGLARHFGQRLGLQAFRRFFDAEKGGAKAQDLNAIYDQIRGDFPDLPSPRAKDDKIAALRGLEAERPEECILIPSEDNFYGANSTGKLARFVQWIYVPAVKDAGEEGQEAKNTALGKLIARAVRAHVNFDADLEELKRTMLERYRELLDRNRESLSVVAQSLQRRLESWAHPGARLDMQWLADPNKSVVMQSPVVGIRAGEGGFDGSLARMGHGLQRSYLLALLQELADSDAPEAPTLLLGCEEPELYQHPPQARHLADVFGHLATGNNQILVTTHSPLFVKGDGFESIRLVQRRGTDSGSKVSATTFGRLCARIREVLGEEQVRPVEGRVAKIHQALQPGIAEMFFARVPILVEGLEDVSYITTELHLSGQWAEFRRLGCHLIPANGKDRLIQPLVIANAMGIPCFAMFDADGDANGDEQRRRHEKDNRALMRILEVEGDPFPAHVVLTDRCAVWPSNLGQTVRAEFGAAYRAVADSVRVRYGHESGLEKNDLFIADWLEAGRSSGHASPTLQRLCTAILKYAGSV